MNLIKKIQEGIVKVVTHSHTVRALLGICTAKKDDEDIYALYVPPATRPKKAVHTRRNPRTRRKQRYWGSS